MVCHPARSCVTLTTSPVPPDGFNNNALIASPIFIRASDCQDIIRGGNRPRVHHLFKNPRLPLSKGQLSCEYVTVRIQYRGPVMPAFKQTIGDAQLAALLAYLESK